MSSSSAPRLVALPPNDNLLAPEQQSVDYDAYVAGHRVTKSVTDLHQFRFTVQYQNNGALTMATAKDALRGEGFDAISGVLATTGSHYLHALSAKEQTVEPGRQVDTDKALLEFSYSHDVRHCVFQFFDDRFQVGRRASSFRDFFAWYGTIMPHIFGLERTLRAVVDKATGRPLRPVLSSFNFHIYFSNFRLPRHAGDIEQTQERVRNIDVLGNIVPQLPGPGRQLNALSSEDLYRLDLTVSKRDEFIRQRTIARNSWYAIEAPFNENGRYISLRAELRNASSEVVRNGVVTEVSPFDTNYSDDYDIALMDFLRDRALEGFMRHLIGDREFDTERDM